MSRDACSWHAYRRPWRVEDIHAGKRWRREVADQLTLSIGVLVLTPENVREPWINFEARALSRSVPDDTRVIPYCFGLGPADYGGPFGDFNGVRADREGTLKFVRSINEAMERRIRDDDLDRVFDRMWDDLKSALDATRSSQAKAERPTRTERELLEEILARVRDMELWTDASVGAGVALPPNSTGSPSERRSLTFTLIALAGLRTVRSSAPSSGGLAVGNEVPKAS